MGAIATLTRKRWVGSSLFRGAAPCPDVRYPLKLQPLPVLPPMTSSLLQFTEGPPHQILTVTPPPDGFALTGRLSIPGDKSISHRALMLGAIASGETRIQGLLLGEDPRSTAACFQAMGATISDLEQDWVTVQGCGLGNLQEPDQVLDAGNSGTTLRLMLGLLASQPGHFFTVTGDASLRSRPMGRVITH